MTTPERKTSEPEFKGLTDSPKEIDAARRFVQGILKRKHLRPEIIESLNDILLDISRLPAVLPESSCEITVSTGYGDQDIGGTEYHSFLLDATHFELVSGGSSFSGPVDTEDYIDAFRFVAEADGFKERKMDVTGWIAEVEECCADPAYYIEMDLDAED
jgi:hypothetical protein